MASMLVFSRILTGLKTTVNDIDVLRTMFSKMNLPTFCRFQLLQVVNFSSSMDAIRLEYSIL